MINKGKVIILSTQLEFGGAQSAAIKLYKGLSEKYDCSLVFLYKKSEAFTDVPKKCLIDRRISSPIDLLKIIYRLIIFLYKEKPMALITFNYYANIISQPIAFFLQIKKRIASQRNPYELIPRHLRKIDKYLCNLKIYTDNVIVSESSKISFKKNGDRYLNKSTVIPNGIEIQELKESKSSLRDKYGIDRKKFIILSVGRLSPEKNHESIIRSIENIPNVQYIIVGEGPLQQELESLSSSKVIFLGVIDNSSIPELLKLSDLFILPSISEGMSNALIEAIAYKSPVLVSDIPANRELLKVNSITDDYSLVPTCDIELWKEKILRVMRERDFRKSLLEQSYRLSENYALSRMIERFERLIRK